MKAENFSESLNQIQDSYIEETVNYHAPAARPKKRGSALKVWRVIAIIACALLAVSIGIVAIGASGGLRMGNAAADFTVPTGDGAKAYDAEDSYSMEGINNSYSEEEMPMTAEGAQAATSAKGDASARPSDASKIIYTAHMSISTKDFAASSQQIETTLQAHDGYIENMDLSNATSSYRSAYYQIRIPAEELDAFLKEAEQFGTITSINKNATDVSESYYDLESRLETAQKKLKRLQELLGQAKDMSDIITLEESISEVEWEIDDLKGSLKNYDSNVRYSTVSIALDEVYQIPNDEAPLTFGERLSQSFTNGLHTFGKVIEEVLVWFAASWLWVLLIGLVLAAVIVIVVKSEKKRKK